MSRMNRIAQLQLAAHAAVANMASPDVQVLEGVVLAGSWDAAEGVCQVMIGSTVGYESPFFSENGLNQPLYLVCRIINHAIGDQYGPVGGERAVVYEGEGGFVCKLVHGPDDSSPVPSGERWIQHRSQAAVMNATQQQAQDTGRGGYDSGRGSFDSLVSQQDPVIPVEWDSSLKLTNDGPTTGDGLGGAILGGSGALTQSQTKSGARSTIDDTNEKIESVTAGGLTVGAYDQVKQIVQSVVAGELETIMDGIAQKITHRVSASVQAILNAETNEISLIVPDLAAGGKIGLGALFEDLPSESGAINQDILSAFGDNVNQFALTNLAALVTLFKNASAITPSQATAIIGQIVLSWLTKIDIPSGSGVVRMAS